MRTYPRLARRLILLSCLMGLSTTSDTVAQEPLDAILKIDRGGQGVATATSAASDLVKRGITLEALLAKARQANPVAKNWILAIAQSIADQQGESAVRPVLERILADKNGDAEVRYWALDRLAGGNAETRRKMLDGRTEDSSLDIRYEAIEQVIKAQPKADDVKSDEAAKGRTVTTYQALLKSARLADQVNDIAGRLKELGVEVDLRQHFGFVSQWQVMGPFDNRGGIGFDKAYPPESEFQQTGKVDIKQRTAGKSSEVSWQPAATDKADGQVDLNPVFNNEKGAVIYALATVTAGSDIDCQVRLGSPNANKVWINGQEATANNVYHTGSQIDQYVAPVKLKKGANTILVKICQNEQTESWAQDLGFKLRFTDATGLAIAVSQ